MDTLLGLLVRSSHPFVGPYGTFVDFVLVEYSTDTNQGRPMDVVTNSFCAVSFQSSSPSCGIIAELFVYFLSFKKGGNVLGNGTWINVGGNQAITYGGLQAASQNGGAPYDDPDGRQSYVPFATLTLTGQRGLLTF